jgi:pimeloyl-ACP methyl ester carboxylesterase
MLNMHGLRIRLLVTFFILLAIGLGLAVSSALAAPINPKIHWNACYPDFGPFECGTVQVPLDYDNPDKAAISIALVRLPAGDPEHKIGSLFINPGGPGGSGVDFALSVAPVLYTQEVRDRFDIVGFDPRGVSRSTALRCFGNPKQWVGYFTAFSFPITLEQDAVWRTADRYLVDACEQRGSRIIDHMSTADVARDLDMLRQAVGDDGLTYAGYSYGTFLGVTYANLFPDNVRALVVDGVLDPIAWTTGLPDQADLPFSTRLRSDEGALGALDEFFRLCDLYSYNCAFGPDSEARFASLADRLRENPLVVILPDGTVFTFQYQDLIGNALSAMYYSGSWPSFADLLASIESMMPPQVVGNNLERFWTDMGFINKRGFPHYPNYLEPFPAVACSDSDNPADYAAWWAAAQESQADYGYFGPIWTYASSICSDWPGSKADRYTGPFTNWTANPVLVVGMKYDPATRYQGAVTVHNLLPNSVLLTVEGWAHTTLMMSTPADAAVGAYLVNPADLPDVEIFQQDWTPFEFPVLALGDAGTLNARLSFNPLLVPQSILKNGK